MVTMPTRGSLSLRTAWAVSSMTRLATWACLAASAISSPASYSLVFGAEQAPAGAEQLHFRASGHMLLARVENFLHMEVISRHRGYSDGGTAVKFLFADLGDRHVELPQSGHDGAHIGALGLERAGVVREEEVEFNASGEHRSRLRGPSPNPQDLFAAGGARSRPGRRPSAPTTRAVRGVTGAASRRPRTEGGTMSTPQSGWDQQYDQPTRPYPAAPPPETGEPSNVAAGKLWAGGFGTAVVAALAALVGILLVRGVLGIGLLSPSDAGAYGDASTTT